MDTKYEPNSMDELIDKIEQNRYEDASLQHQLCNELYDMASVQNDEETMGVARFYASEALYASMPNEAREYAREALSLLKKSTQYELLARTYNLLGILSNNRDDYSNAIDYLLECEELCQQHGFRYLNGLCACNIGVIFQFLEDYKRAIFYFKKGVECFEKESGRAYINIVSINLNLFVCYSRINDIDNANRCLELLKENTEYVAPKFVLPFYEAQYHALMNEPEQQKECIKLAIEEAITVECPTEDIDSYQFLCKFLYEQRDTENLIKVLEYLEKVVDPSSFPRIRIIFLEYLLECIEQERDYDRYVKWSKEYIKTYAMISEYYHQSIVDSVNLRFAVRTHKEVENDLKAKARTDNLTGINNRSGFHHYTESLFLRAISNHKPIAFFVIDIDFFKQINDIYGHTYGDECLIKLSDILKSLQSDNTIVGRYGGDEFVVLCYGRDFEPEDMAQTIKSSMEKLRLEANGSQVSDILTLSQGIYYGIPDENDSVLGFMNEADQALYDVKNNGKNNYIIRQKL